MKDLKDMSYKELEELIRRAKKEKKARVDQSFTIYNHFKSGYAIAA